MSDLFIGTSAYPEADESLLKEAGISWVRQGFPVPFEGKIGGRTTDAFHKAKARAEDWNARGMKIMGVTPGPGVMTWKPDEQGKMRGVWNSRYPEWMGELGSEELCQNYQEICGFLADQLHGVVEMWQIANELNVNYPRLKAGASCFTEGPCCTTSPQALIRAVPALLRYVFFIMCAEHSQKHTT